jgi:S1-C subfamily serine protease
MIRRPLVSSATTLVASLVTVLLLVPLARAPLDAAPRRDGSLDVVFGDLPRHFGDGRVDAPRHGALVLEVLTGGAGDRKGMREGDVIVEFENQPVTSATELAGRIRREGEGALVSISVWRDGSRTWLGLARLSGRVPPGALEDEVAALRAEVAALRDEVAALREEVGKRP